MNKCPACGRQMMASQKICQCRITPGERAGIPFAWLFRSAKDFFMDLYLTRNLSGGGARYVDRFTLKGAVLAILMGAGAVWAAAAPSFMLFVFLEGGLNYQGTAHREMTAKNVVSGNFPFWLLACAAYVGASSGIHTFYNYGGKFNAAERFRMFCVKAAHVCAGGFAGAVVASLFGIMAVNMGETSREASIFPLLAFTMIPLGGAMARYALYRKTGI